MVGLDYFFRDESKRQTASIVRRAERRRFPDQPDGVVSYFFESLDFTATERKLNAYYAEFQPVTPEEAVPHVHPGVEFLYVLGGCLVITIGRAQHELGEGDSIYFDASVPPGDLAPVDFYRAEITFAALPVAERERFYAMGTNYSLSDEQIDALLAVGPRLLKESPEYIKLVRALE